VQAFDVSGTLRRIRRRADLSQRELAGLLQVSKSSIAAMEAGERGIDVRLLARAAAGAGLRLAMLDIDGDEIRPMSPDSVRDLVGRRFPAHLDTRHGDEGGGLYEPRRDRPEVWFTFDRDRRGRDARRRASAPPDDHHPVRPGDSPQERRAARRRAALLREREDRARRRAAAVFQPADDDFTCTCPARCEELDDYSGRPVHTDECPCRCDVG
jgi:transcriptional regulator with XRE-family HTH domain